MNPEKHRNDLVDFQGKAQLIVRRDNFVPGDKTNDWMGVVDEFSSKLQDVARPGVLAPMIAKFSTTLPINMFVYQSAIMNLMQNFCSYTVMSLCGIPKVTLAGTEEDWKALVGQIEALDLPGFDWDLKAWHDALLMVTTKLLECYQQKDKANLNFFRNIYKYGEASGGPRVNGWICLLFPYLGDSFTRSSKNYSSLTWHLNHTSDISRIGCTADAFPTGLNKVPFQWKIGTLTLNMLLFSGFDGPIVNYDSGVETRFAYAVTRSQASIFY
jgi:hypothetical protein